MTCPAAGPNPQCKFVNDACVPNNTTSRMSQATCAGTDQASCESSGEGCIFDADAKTCTAGSKKLEIPRPTEQDCNQRAKQVDCNNGCVWKNNVPQGQPQCVAVPAKKTKKQASLSKK